MKRKWVDEVQLQEEWNVPYKIARHRTYMYWSHPDLFPCDEMGYRIPTGFSSFADKFHGSRAAQRIFCIGGSTTFGLFCGYDECYPHLLESMLDDSAVFNLGLCGLDAKGALHVLADLLRLEFAPDLVIFLDGINEKQGWIQAVEGAEYYDETCWQYRCFNELISNHNIPMSLRWEKKENAAERSKKKPLKVNCASTGGAVLNPLRFVDAQSNSYSKSNSAIRKIADAWGIRSVFFLEPTVWDVWNGEHDLLYDYIKALYRGITVRCPDVIDLSRATLLRSDNFIEWKHLNAEGHRILAETIAKEVIRKFQSNDRYSLSITKV